MGRTSTVRNAVQRSSIHRIRIAGHALPSSRATALTATPTRSLNLISTSPTQSRHYALSRYPDRSNRFTRSNSSSHRKQQQQQDGGQEDGRSILPQLPKDPNGVLQLDSNKAAAILLGQSSLIVTREIEMMNIFLGYEQANRYALLSPEGNKVGYLMEEEVGLMGGAIQRQLLKTHRPFKAVVLDLEGKPVLRISRGVTLINSRTRVWSIDQESSGDGSNPQERLVGEVVQNFHVWRRKYELFRSVSGDDSTRDQQSDSQQETSDSKDLVPTEQLDQFAKVDSGLLSWDFLLQDQNGAILGAINRNFRGFGRELFTDTGQYVVRFRDVEPQELHTPARLVDTPSGQAVAVNPQTSNNSGGGELLLKQDSRPMTLDERAISLAAAISIDFDYFSRHSSWGGGFMPFFWMGGGGSPPPPEGDTEVPTTTGQDSSGIQSSPELPGRDGGLGSGTAAGYGMMGGGSQYEGDSSNDFPQNDNNNNYPDSGFGPDSPPPPEAGNQNDGWGFGSREEQGMGQNEEVWGGGDNDPWSEATNQGGDGGGGLFGGWSLGDFLGGDD